MLIRGLDIEDFAIYDRFSIDFSPNINIISGENSVGKTVLLKTIYSMVKTLDNIYIESTNPLKPKITVDKVKEMLMEKFIGVFRPDNGEIGRLVKRKVGRNSSIVRLKINSNDEFEFSFSQTLKLSKEIKKLADKVHAVYIPPKEIISATENFSSLYDDYHIAFEETYSDLSKLLLKPLKRGPNSQEQDKVLKIFENIIEGKVIQKQGGKFFLKTKGIGEIEMGLVAEGYRKLATILHLISNGSLGPETVLFWDEPESNLNPKSIQSLVKVIVELAKMGVQIFIATHSYFIQQEFTMFSEYESSKANLDVKFFSLYRNKDVKDGRGSILVESADSIKNISYNAIVDEFKQLYNRGVEKLYEGRKN